MANYDFRSLSSYDFALLARDLLQAELHIHLESFSAGPDAGIDFRYRDENTNLVVQCKHYVDSGFAALASVLRRKERKKLEELSPTRYIVVTSVPLTPHRKDELKQILNSQSVSLGDIYGQEDLNNVLGRHPDIERKHFKLWLTSEPVLRRVLDAGIFADSDAHLERVRLRLCRYVPNPSFQRARELLGKSHYCIIAGIPGIGKTTLAEVLLADLVDRQGFEAFRIAHNLDEIRPVKNSRRKQVFYFDDFLGTTALDSLQRNEDQRLIELMEEVASNANWRFILTTREYVLNSAKLHSESFAHPRVDFTMCVVKLDDYTRPIRARILYNHLYFSDLPKAHKLALLQNRGYETILRHRNYNPRIIEYMTQTQHACAVTPSVYLNEFTDSLEHPTRIWDHAFRHRISEPARHLLLALVSLPDMVLLADLEKAFWTFYLFRQKQFGFSTRSGDWHDALKELDGSFVMTRKIGADVAISFHSPSVRDYMEDFLFNSEGDVRDLFSGAHFYEQYVQLWQGKGGQRYPGVSRNPGEFLRHLRLKLFGPTATVVRRVFADGEVIGLGHLTISNEERARFTVGVVDALECSAGEQLLVEITTALTKMWEQGQADREDLNRLLNSLTKRGLRHDEGVFVAAKECILTKAEEIEHYRAIADFVEMYPDQISREEIDHLGIEFLKFAEDYSTDSNDDPDWLRQIASDFEFVGEKFDLNVSRFSEPLNNRADEIESERAERESEEDDQEGWESASPPTDDVHSMFESLQQELED